MSRRRGALLALVCLAAAGCGSDDDEPERGATTGRTASPTVTTPATTPSAPTATAPATTPPPPTSPAQTDEGGDEEPIRIPARFTVRGGRLRPSSVSVPAFLAVEVSVRNLDRVPRTVTVRADRAYRLVARPGGRAARLVPGQRPGTYAVTVAGGGRATLVSGGEPGP